MIIPHFAVFVNEKKVDCAVYATQCFKSQKISRIKCFRRHGFFFIITLSNGAIQYINIENA